MLSHRVPCLCNLVDFCVLTLPCQSKETREGPGRITLEGKKSPAFGEKKTAKLSTKMAQKERIKTLDDFPHLAVLSLSRDILFVLPPMVLLLFLERNSNVLSTFAL